MRTPIVLLGVFVSSVSIAQPSDIPLSNWTVPPYRGSSASGGLTTMADVTPGIGFVGVAPCRLVDTRQAGFPAGYGTPALSAGVPRNFDLNSDPLCTGIPAGVDAYSLNITVTNTQGPGFILIYPQGGAQPSVSTVNYVAGQTIANAAVVPAGTGGGVTVIAGVSGTDLIIDINGYFTDQYNPGVSLHAASSNAAPAILGENTSTVANAVAMQGVITSTTPGDFATAVRAINNGNGYGVWGTSATGYGVVAGGFAGAVWARASGTAPGVSGVYGSTSPPIPPFPASPPTNYGVFGESLVTTGASAGVLGVNGGGRITGVINTDDAGVRGEGKGGFGVFGLTQVDPSGFPVDAVRGALVNGSGGDVARGILGLGAGATSYGVYSGGDYGGTGAKYFVEPHPKDASKVIRYVSLEGNESGTYFRGRGKFQNGIATIDVPEDFQLVTDREGLSVVATPIGPMATISVASVGLDRIVLRGSRDVEFFYIVNGVRKTHKHLTPIGPGREYMPENAEAKIPLYLTEGQKEMLISNGTYKPDGTVNMETARRLGWDKEWEKRERPAPQPTSE